MILLLNFDGRRQSHVWTYRNLEILSSGGHARHGRRLQTLALQGAPSHIAAKILPQSLKAPDHVKLPIRKVLQKAVTHQSCDILPVVITLVGQFFLKYGAKGNNGREGITKNHELNEEIATQHTKGCRQQNGEQSSDFDHRRQKFENPQIGEREAADAAVTRAEQHVPVRQQCIQQSLVPRAR